MNKKIIVPIALILLVGLSILVYASNYDSIVEVDVPIYKGWNLVYGLFEPSQLDDWVTDDKVNIKAIYAFIPTTQEYFQVYPNDAGDLTMELRSKHNYDDEELRISSLWVYSDVETGEVFNGKMNAVEYNVASPLPLSEYSLFTIYRGWNFLAITPDMIDKSLNEIKGDCDIERAHIWYPQDNYWGTISKSSRITQESIGIGVVIKVSSDCNLRETEETIPPPQLP